MTDLIRKHVVSLELSEKLKKAGYDQESAYFCWEIFNEAITTISERDENYVAAPLATEILEKLPKHFDGNSMFVDIWNDSKEFETSLMKQTFGHCGVEEETLKISTGENLSDCLAQLWLYLNENNQTTPEKESKK